MKTKNRGNLLLVSALFVLVTNFAITQGCSSSSQTTEKPDVTCPEHDCNDGKKCYTHDQQCDGTKNCDDNTDEDAGHCDHKGYPTFENVTCADVSGKDEKSYDLCFKVIYPNDDQTDYMLLEDGHGWLTYSGKMKDENVVAVFSYPDPEDNETLATAQFHSMHVATCTDLEIDLDTGKSSCVVHDPTEIGPTDDGVSEKSGKTSEKRGELHRKGYELDLHVYFDDDMNDHYKGNTEKTKQKIKGIMTYVQEMYEERDTLQTIIKFKTTIEHKKNLRLAGPMRQYGQNRGGNMWEQMGNIATSSPSADLYAFVTSRKGAIGGGWGMVGSVCGSRSQSVSITRYQGTASRTAWIIGHEIGHNLGMPHDFIGSSQSNVRKDSKGKSCYGYMDYKSNTNYWSTCNVEQFTNQNKNCLRKLGSNEPNPEIPTSPPGLCEDDSAYAKNCQSFKWACTDSRYPWFRNKCKKTCSAC